MSVPAEKKRAGRDLSPRERFLILGWAVAGMLAVGGYVYVDHLHSELDAANAEIRDLNEAGGPLMRALADVVEEYERDRSQHDLPATEGGVVTDGTTSEEHLGEDDGE